jgi:hypothetical protein
MRDKLRSSGLGRSMRALVMFSSLGFLLVSSSAHAYTTLGSSFAPYVDVYDSTAYLGSTTNYFNQAVTSLPLTNTFSGNPYASATAAGGADPSVSALAEASGGALYVSGQSTYSAGAGVNLLYYFEVVGPAANTPLPGAVTFAINISGSNTEKDGYGDIIASSSSAASLVIGVSGTGEFYSNTTAGSYSVPLTLFSDTVYFVEMNVSAQAESNGGTAVGDASIDPVFTLGPGSDDYSIIYSPGITQGIASGVPEFSTWAMMLLGFTCLGLLAYRRRSQEVLA